MTYPRGSSNTNQRGNTAQRRARKHWLLTTYEAAEGPGLVYCYRCAELLDWFTVTIDRILPACDGGTYRLEGIRPACGRCNSVTGGRIGAARSRVGRAS